MRVLFVARDAKSSTETCGAQISRKPVEHRNGHPNHATEQTYLLVVEIVSC